MKYNTIGSSSSSGEGKKSTLTIYADLNLADKNKNTAMETEVSKLKNELLQAQNALDKQTRKCRQLVEEFTRRLQEKEFQYKYEKNLREDQLARVLRTLLLVEARLKQEQKLILQQLKGKDFIIQKQNNEIRQLLSCQYCKNCSQYYNPSISAGSLDSSSEYMLTGNQESNFCSLDSSTELYATLSDKDSVSNKSDMLDDSGSNKIKFPDGNVKQHYQKNKGQDSLERKFRKFSHRKSIGNYFEVLKLRDDNGSPFSNEDNTSNDYDNFDSLPPESSTDAISLISQESENLSDNEILEKNDTIFNSNQEASNNLSLSESNITVIHNIVPSIKTVNMFQDEEDNEKQKEENGTNSFSENNLSDSIPVFDAEGETNDKWYVSASDQEDEEQKNIYRNNPVLECVNQILLRNISDTLNSPPKTPNVERKSSKNKKVKFNDEEILIDDQVLTEENLREKENEVQEYYETPIQKVPNFYETPQSIYSNDYEQIISSSSGPLSSPNVAPRQKDVESMSRNNNVLRRNKILRTPPALPPKPTNLTSKSKIQDNSFKLLIDKSSDIISLDSEPDYCSISELNLPTNRIPPSKKIIVNAEINTSIPKNIEKVVEPSAESNHYDPVDNENNDMIMKTIEKVNIQVAKQTIICSEDSIISPSKLSHSIPKLPLVSEIIIPEEGDKEKEEMITQDNYVKNNSQMRNILGNTPKRRPISIGSSVSSLIMGFNNRELMDELTKEPIKPNPRKRIISSFENLQDIRKQYSPKSKSEILNNSDFNLSQNISDFSLDQNFEEFKLEDCEIEEYASDILDTEKIEQVTEKRNISEVENVSETMEKTRSDEVIIPNLKKQCVELFKQQLEKQKGGTEHLMIDNKNNKRSNEPSYEHFLECTGLSSKSILTPSRIPTTHKTVLKPKDIKVRSKSKSNNYFDNTHSKSIKYWSEPFI